MKNNTQIKQESQSEFQTSDEILEFLKDIRRDNTKIFVITMQTDAYSDFGINEGDIALVERTNKNDESRLSAWHKKDKTTVDLGFAYDNFGEISIGIPRYEEARYKKRSVEFIGFVVGIIRAINPQLPAPETVNEAIETTEITAVCGECKAQLTGTPVFLKAMGWKLRSETLCLRCDLY